jgi:hypothetical protein
VMRALLFGRLRDLVPLCAPGKSILYHFG